VIYLLALLPATALTIAGYFVLFLSTRFEGGMRSFGKYLGFWAFTLAALIILGAIVAAAHGHRHCPMSWHHGMDERMPPPWSRESPRQAAPQPENRAPAASSNPAETPSSPPR
jgi:hypothetical protein